MQKTIVVMLPWLAHGHVSPYLELAKKLAQRNFHIHICSTPANLTSIRSKVSKQFSSSIVLTEIHLEPLPELPPPRHTTNGLPPHLMSTLKLAFDRSGPPELADVMETLKPALLIYDFLLPWAPEVAKSHSIPAVTFMSMGAGMSSYVLHALKVLNGDEPDEFPFEEIFHLDDGMKRMFYQLMESSSGGLSEKDRALQSIERSSNIILMKTFHELEGKYMEYLSGLAGKKVIPVGPLVQDPMLHYLNETDLIKWLDSKPESSTIFVSFGSEYFLSETERHEIAHGLELSNLNFIWVVRFPCGEKPNLETVLPFGFLERTRGRGMVIENWAPQARVLGHSSIGGFVSHCGWNSVMESMKLGVPIIAMAMQLDQPMNAKVIEDARVGMEVKRDPKTGRFERDGIGRVIREVVVERGGEKVRKKVKELSEKIRSKGEEEIDGVVDELMKLCGM